jgi:hypothetical protein
VARVQRQVVLEAEVRCYHCGRQVGQVRLPQGSTAGRPILTMDQTMMALPPGELAKVRCPVCAGPTYLDDVQTRYDLPPEAYAPGLPGRPRKARLDVA